MRFEQHLNEYMEDSVPKAIRVVSGENVLIKNEEIMENSFSLTESVDIGSCNSSYVTFKSPKFIANKNFGLEISVNGSEYELINTYTVKTKIKRGNYYEYTAYDMMEELITDTDMTYWYADYRKDAPNSTQIIWDFLDELVRMNIMHPYSIPMFSWGGLDGYLTQEIVTLGDILKPILEIYSMGAIMSQGKIKLVMPIDPTDFGDIKDSPIAYHYEWQWEHPSLSSLSRYAGASCLERGIKVTQARSDKLGEGLLGDMRLGQQYIGEPLLYDIRDNMFATSTPQWALNGFIEELTSPIATTWTFGDINAVVRGNPCIEVGDRVRVGNYIFVINQRTLTGVQGMRDTLSTVNAHEYNPNSIVDRLDELTAGTYIPDGDRKIEKGTFHDFEYYSGELHLGENDRGLIYAGIPTVRCDMSENYTSTVTSNPTKNISLTEHYNNADYETLDNAIKVARAGLYLLSAQVYVSGGVTSGDTIHFLAYRDDTVVAESMDRQGGNYFTMSINQIIWIDAGQEISFRAYNQARTTELTVSAINTRSNFNLVRLG